LATETKFLDYFLGSTLTLLTNCVYSDKPPIKILESELSILRHGRMTITEYYNEVKRQQKLPINKTIMTYGKDSVITKETNKTMLYEYLYPG